MNSTVIQGITMGSNSIIGAGAVVTKNIGTMLLQSVIQFLNIGRTISRF